MHTSQRVSFAADQLTRYGEVADARILDILDLLAQINDDMQHDRQKSIVAGGVAQAVQLLRAVEGDYAP